MESEKVKKIKKALECCKQNEIENTCEYCSKCPASDWDYETECNVELFQEALILINELESENKNLIWEKQTLEDKDTLLAKLGEMVQETQQLKARIAELESENKSLQDLCNKTYEDLTKEIDRLEKGNKDYYDRLNNLQTYIDNHEEIWEGNTNNVLKQFAERLKEKGKSTYDFFQCPTKENRVVSISDIDETLEEFI